MTESTLQKTSNHNSSIDIARYVCAVMVIANHTRVFADIDKSIWDFLNAVFFRNAVLFFFAVSGYFFIKNALGDVQKEKAYLLHIVKTYAFWSCIYLIEEFISDVLFGSVSVLNFVKSSVIGFFITGSHYHFWYFPALIYAVVLVMIIHRLKIMKILPVLCVLLLPFACLGYAYYGAVNGAPALSYILRTRLYTVINRAIFTAIPFFSCGYFIEKIESLKLSKGKIRNIWLVVACLNLLEMFILHRLDWIRWPNVSVGVYPFIILSIALLNAYPMPRFHKSAKLFRYLANFTYYSHPLFIIVFSGIFSAFGIKLSKMQTLKFIIVTVATFTVGALIYQLKFTKKHKI